MLYETENIGADLGHDLLKMLVVPRPIAWVTTLRPNGVVNVAPFACYSMLGFGPMLIGLSFGSVRGVHKKDTLKNIERSGELVIHSVTEDLLERVVGTARPAPIDESKAISARVTLVASHAIQTPRIAECASAMECRVEAIHPVGSGHNLVIARVVVVHLDDARFPNGQPDYDRFRPVARMHDEFFGKLGEVVYVGRPDSNSQPDSIRG